MTAIAKFQVKTVTVVIPAHNEESSIENCIYSVANSGIDTNIFVSNNCSDDKTSSVLDKSNVNMNRRNLDTLLSPVNHFVSSGRWALQNSNSKYFCFLAGDDLFSPEFVQDSTSKLRNAPGFTMTFPSVNWFSGEASRNRIKAPNLGSKFGTYRQLKALMLPNTREVPTQVYGLFTRDAFEDLIDEFEKFDGGFGADFFAILFILRSHRSIPVRKYFVLRRVREGEDLRNRVGFQPKKTKNTLWMILDYLRLHFAINDQLAKTLSLGRGWPLIMSRLVIHIFRFPQIWIETPVHVLRRIK